MSDARPVLVSGGTGLIGGRLLGLLGRDGIPARALSRRPESAEVPPSATAVGWDGVRAPRETVAGAAAIVHLAGEPVFAGPLTAARRKRIYDSRIASTRALVETVGELPSSERPRALVCASAVGYYGSRGEEELTEESAPGTGFLAEVCIDWEKEAAAAREHGLRVVSLRIGIALSRDGGALGPMARVFRLGLGGKLGNGKQWFPWVHVDDVVGLLRAALEHESYDGPVNAAAPGCVRNADLTRELAAAVKRPAWFSVPGFALKTALGDLSDELLGSRRVLPARAQAQGYRFAHAELASALAAELST